MAKKEIRKELLKNKRLVGVVETQNNKFAIFADKNATQKKIEEISSIIQTAIEETKKGG